jgi:integrase/recombinase XerD
MIRSDAPVSDQEKHDKTPAAPQAAHGQAYRPQLWLGVNNRAPMTANGIYQMIVRRGRQCGVEVYPHRFRHHFSHTWLDRGGAEGDLMEPRVT